MTSVSVIEPDTRAPTQHQQQQVSSSLNFTSVNKMSLFSLEKRIDYHLSRIMKGHRLINFKNSIERLPTEKRICECIIEVLMSSLNLITRKTPMIVDAKAKIDHIPHLFEEGSYSLDEMGQVFKEKLNEMRPVATALEQIIWALNSNKEHIRYIVRVFTVPETYQRCELNTNDPGSVVQLRHFIADTIGHCEEVILVCRAIRAQLSEAFVSTFLNHF